MSIIKGEITFEKDAPSFTGATLHVYLENISFIDAASEVVADYIEWNINFNPNTSNSIPFEIVYKNLDPGDRFAIRVHIDVDKDGKVSKGDFINVQSYPVITFGYPKEITVIVKQIK